MYLSPEMKKGIMGKYISIAQDVFQINNTERGFVQLWDCKARKIEISILKYNQYYLVQEVYAVIRWLIYYYTLELQGGIIHSSAVEYDGKGIIIIGDKGTGKTTLLTALLNEGAKYIASDRSFFWKQGKKIRICGWICTYRADMNSLRLSLDNNKLQVIKGYIEKKRNDSEFIYNGKFRFPTCDFLSLLRFDTGYSAELSKIIYLDGHVDQEGEVIIEKENLTQRLNEQLLYINLPKELSNQKPIRNAKALEKIDMYRVVGRKQPVEMTKQILESIWRD